MTHIDTASLAVLDQRLAEVGTVVDELVRCYREMAETTPDPVKRHLELFLAFYGSDYTTMTHVLVETLHRLAEPAQ